MAIERDNIHYSNRNILGYNLPFNFVISEREAGKSTDFWLWIYNKWKKLGLTCLVVRRKVVHITKAYIEDIAKIINKFTDDNVKFEYSQSTIKDGIVDINIEGKPFIRIVALSIDITAVKSLVLLNLGTIIFDEFICNARFGEKYLKDEAFKFMEIYNTFRRESKNLKCFFLGNPYSLYNPYFVYFNIPTKQLQRGVIISDKKSYVVECYEMKKELRDKILEENPLYQFDNAYTKYAFNGLNINDANIRINELTPPNFSLYFVFRIEGKYIAVYKNNDIFNDDYVYHITFISPEKISHKRDIFVFDFTELVDHTTLLSSEDRYKFSRFKTHVRNRAVAFNSIECYYLFEEIFYNL